MSRRPRTRQARGRSRVGERFTVDVGPVAHGGHCVARLAEGRVVFVRHAIPGERVEVEVTEGTDGDRFWRADAVAVLTASPDRVAAPCPVAGPGLCGGCDFQHVSLDRQRALKAEVVSEQLRRLAGLDVAVVVEAVPGDVDGLRWRTRTRFAHLPDGGRAMRKHRSHDLVPVDDCLIAAPGSSTPSTVEDVAAAGGAHEFAVAEDGFWQVHPGAPTVLVETVLELLDPQPGERVLDLYAGVGLFAAFLADRVGPGRVVAVEGHAGAARDAARTCRPPYGSSAATSAGCSPRAWTSRSTSWSSTRHARAPAGPWSSRWSTAPRAPSRTSPATRPPSPATSPSSPSTATRWRRCVPSTCSR